MYICSKCKTPVEVNHIDKPVLKCLCEGSTIITGMESNLYGVGGMSVGETKNHNLEDSSIVVVRAMMVGVSAVEFFEKNKSFIHANELVIVDETTGRKFAFTLSAKEL